MSTRHDRVVRWAWRWTLLSFLAFGGVYFLGWFVTWNWDTFEKCEIFRDQRYEPAIAELSANFPFKNTCNADYDMVPAWLNPTIVVLGVAAVLSVACLIGASVHRKQVLARL